MNNNLKMHKSQLYYNLEDLLVKDFYNYKKLKAYYYYDIKDNKINVIEDELLKMDQEYELLKNKNDKTKKSTNINKNKTKINFKTFFSNQPRDNKS